MKLIKLSVIIIIIICFNIKAYAQKPSLVIFNLDQNAYFPDKEKYYNSAKLSLMSKLNESGFISVNGKEYLKKINIFNTVNFDKIIENSDVLSQMSKANLFIMLGLNIQIQKNKYIKISVNADILNSQTKSIITSWSTPRKLIKHSIDCDQICRNLLISETIIVLSDQLGKSLAEILNNSDLNKVNYTKISKVYNFKTLNFKQQNITKLTDLMINEFPGFIKLSNEEFYGDQAMWTYYSTTDKLKLKKWLAIALKETGLSLDDDYELSISDNNFFIKKFPKFAPVGSIGNSQKFN
jgi:hypothetical protein|tara:strand:- start:4767 stop:5651 length:885 start_codon:yes stop_codon:yes gene_type:complete